MAFKKIPQISISGGSYNGSVYSISFQNNYDQSPSRLTVQIINESGKYSISKANLGSTATIQIGSISFLCELWEYRTIKQLGQSILELIFVDKSIRLDRIWVSLFRRADNVNGAGGTAFTKTKKIQRDNMTPVLKYFDVQGSRFYYFTFLKSTINTEVTRSLKQGNYSKYDLDAGGEIVVGSEQYVANSCSVPNVLYDFPTLLGLCTNLVGIASAYGLNTSYKNSYIGTLRQVLQNWCADFGFTFSWQSINGLNLAVIRDAKIPYVIPSQSSFTQGSVIKIESGSSMESTFAQYGIAWYEKEGQDQRTNTISQTKYYPVNYYPFSLSFVYYQGNIFDVDGNSLGSGDTRAQSEFITSALMSYYYEPFRKYYNWYVLGVLSGSSIGKGAIPLGIIKIVAYTSATDTGTQIANALEQFGQTATANFIKDQITNFGQNNIEYYIAYYDPAIEENFVNYEREIISNYIGKYYRGPTITYFSDTQCNNKFFFKKTEEEVPGGQRYSYYQGNPPPFSSLIKSAAQLAKVDSASNSNINKGSEYTIFSRQGSFSHSQDEFNSALGLYDNQVSLANKYLPSKLKIEGEVLKAFQQLQQAGTIDSGLDLTNLYFFMGVTKSKIDSDTGISISYNGRQANPRETAAQLDVAQNDAPCDFTKLCLTEEDAIQKAVDQSQSQTENSSQDKQPPVGLFSPAIGYSAQVRFNGQTVNVVAPSDSAYQGYSKITTEIQTVDQTDNSTGQIKSYKYGSVGNAPKLSEIRVVDINFTSEEFDPTDTATISAAANDFKSTQTITNNNYRDFLSITSTEYLDSAPGVTSGLESIDTNITDNGVEVTYKYATNPPKIPSPNVILSQFENRKNRNSPR